MEPVSLDSDWTDSITFKIKQVKQEIDVLNNTREYWVDRGIFSPTNFDVDELDCMALILVMPSTRLCPLGHNPNRVHWSRLYL